MIPNSSYKNQPTSEKGVPLSGLNIKTNDDAESIFSSPQISQTPIEHKQSPLRVKP